MIEGGKGGALTATGLHFERRVDFLTLLNEVPGYDVKKRRNKIGYAITYEGSEVARSFKKFEFYGYLDEIGIQWRGKVSKRLLPDDAIFVLLRDTLFIIEVKFQQVSGSVDEKLQTCDFKKKYYVRLFAGSGVLVEYVYVLNKNWFGAAGYKDVLDYILSVGCHYHFDFVPLSWFGLPTPK